MQGLSHSLTKYPGDRVTAKVFNLLVFLLLSSVLTPSQHRFYVAIHTDFFMQLYYTCSKS